MDGGASCKNKKKKIVILGAGPVGLVMSYLLWKEGFSDIWLIEKRAEYTRHQIIGTGLGTLQNITPPKVYKELLSQSCYVTSPAISAEALCYIKSPIRKKYNKIDSNVSFPIRLFEKLMKEFMQSKVNVICPSTESYEIKLNTNEGAILFS